MKIGLIASILAHASIMIWGLVALPTPKTLDVAEVDALPVEIVPFEALSQKRAGNPDAAPETPIPEDPTPEPPKPVEEAPPADTPTPEPAKQPVETSAPPPAPQPAEATPQEPEPETASAPLPDPTPAPESEMPPEPKPEPAETIQFASAPSPRARPQPPRRPPQPDTPNTTTQDFNQDKITALLNRQRPQGAAPQPETPQTTGVRGGDNSKKLSQNEIDYLRQQFERCWNLQTGMASAESMAVLVQIKLNPDGTLAAAPRVLNPNGALQFQIAAERALRAVQTCAPYDYLPPEKHEDWQVLEFNFDPSRMFHR